MTTEWSRINKYYTWGKEDDLYVSESWISSELGASVRGRVAPIHHFIGPTVGREIQKGGRQMSGCRVLPSTCRNPFLVVQPATDHSKAGQLARRLLQY